MISRGLTRAVATRALATGIAFSGMAMGTIARADDAAAPPAATAGGNGQTAPSGNGLAEIVVTATRRDTSLQTTPIAVSAVNAALIAQTSPRDIADIAAYVPNFSADTIANFNAASFAMRGAGQTNIIVYFEPPVGVLVDDFVVSSVQTQLLDTFDISQVEVLRGPQGTLFGKNTTGGAVTVKTKRPLLDTWGVDAHVQLGTYTGRGEYDQTYQLAVNVPLGHTLAARVVGGWEKSDGYYKNGACYGPVHGINPATAFEGVSGCLDGKNAGGKNVGQVRAKLLWKPTDRLTVLGQYEWLRDKSQTVPSVNENYLYGGTAPFLTSALGTIRQNPASSDPLDNAAVSYRQAGLIKMQNGQRISVDGFYLNADYRLDFGTLSSVTGWRNQRSRLPNSYAGAVAIAADGTPLSFFDATRDDNRATFQQELRFATSFGGPFDMVVGGFYQHENVDFCVDQLLGFLDLTSGPLPFGNWNDTPYILCSAQRASSKAAFAEGTYKLTHRLTLTAGARYTWDDKTWSGRQQVFIPQLNGGFDPNIKINSALDANVYAYPAGVIQLHDSAREPTYRASLGWQAQSALYFYGTFSHGFKSGAYNDQIGGFGAFGTDLNAFREAAAATKPEKADSYEIGVKSEFLDHRVRFNLTAFTVHYTNLQEQLNVPLVVNGAPNQVTIFVNAASSTVRGIEAEATAKVGRDFTLRSTLGYQSGHYVSYTAPTAGYDLATAPLPRTPKVQFTIDGLYEHPLGDHYKLAIDASAAYVSSNLDTQSITDPQGNTYLNARTLVNASLTIARVDDAYAVRIIGRNLTDARYRLAEQNVAGLWLNSNFGAPRYLGLDFTVKFRSKT